LVVAGGLAAGDDHRVVVGFVVEADEAEVGQGAEAGFPQVFGDLVVAGDENGRKRPEALVASNSSLLNEVGMLGSDPAMCGGPGDRQVAGPS
ncbi:hypothetical protein ACWEKM_45640, partial [Streptomyces sp. NPDC004752]